MALILNIETATDICSVCISENTSILSIAETTEPYNHASQLTLLVKKCILNAKVPLKDISAVAISSGPGSYTALRIGTSTAKGICYSLQKPLIAIDTLQSIAHAAAQESGTDSLYCSMIDARRMDAYCAIYDHKNKLFRQSEFITVEANTFQELISDGHHLVLCGNGAEKCRELFPAKPIVFSGVQCSAKNLVPLAVEAYEKELFEDVAYYTPYYLKRPNITVPKKIL